MEFPLNKILDATVRKYELSSSMIKYSLKLEEQPELLLEYPAKDQHKRLKIVFNDIFDEKVKYKMNFD